MRQAPQTDRLWSTLPVNGSIYTDLHSIFTEQFFSFIRKGGTGKVQNDHTTHARMQLQHKQGFSLTLSHITGH